MTKEKTVWIVKPSSSKVLKGRRDILAHKVSTRTANHHESLRDAANEGLRGPFNFDLYSAKIGKRGEVISSRKVLSNYPGRPTEEWFPHKYGPAALDGAAPQILMLQDRMPVGVADSMYAFLNTDTPKKRPHLYRNEIEMALLESDLPASEVDKAMKMFPNIDQLFGYLERGGHKKILHLINRLLSC